MITIIRIESILYFLTPYEIYKVYCITINLSRNKKLFLSVSGARICPKLTHVLQDLLATPEWSKLAEKSGYSDWLECLFELSSKMTGEMAVKIPSRGRCFDGVKGTLF